jgi:hypothetical protein
MPIVPQISKRRSSSFLVLSFLRLGKEEKVIPYSIQQLYSMDIIWRGLLDSK